ncbi:HNH endonuclease family protein [Nocardioides sp.]|uniref:HNH endonuclease family protein n=1 Tax=Nocardioides sp. TaxID=35761 RepID=UPI0035B05062
MISLGRVLATSAGTLLLSGTLVGLTAGSAHADSTWSGTLTTGISAIAVGTEDRTGYSRDLFDHWVDADGDGCDTREEVLISEAEEAPTIGSGCSLSGGRWYSYYEGASQTSASALDIDHLVPLAEAWDSGARTWTAARREAYANDMGDTRSLVGVTASYNRSKGDQDVAEWLPPINQCRYVKEWVAAKIRWSLTADSTEVGALQDVAAGCTDSAITVTVVS